MVTETLQGYQAYKNRNDLARYGPNSLLLFALETKFQLEDIHTIAATVVIDQEGKGGDKKCDLVYVEREEGYAVVAQGYIAQDETKAEAPANKAADLNTAASWLLTRPIEDLPEVLQPAAIELRNALEAGEISYLRFWYVHNLPESKNVNDELVTVTHTANAALRTHYPDCEDMSVAAIEVGRSRLDEWYRSLKVPILVTDTMNVQVPGGYSLAKDDWDAFVTAVPAHWLYNLYQEYRSNLFSANIRGYLGSRRAQANINNGIKNTADQDPHHFWVYNNGLTALVHDYKYDADSGVLEISGLSIVNGAQTTGAIGSLDNAPARSAMVAVRFVKCGNQTTVIDIIKYNNSQNRVQAPDFRSNDSVQKRLVQEFEEIPAAIYRGGRRGGAEDVIRRPANLVPSYTAAQALVAFHQNPVIAYNRKSNIWQSNTHYPRYFNDRTTAKHIVFAYSLLRAVQNAKSELNALERTEEITAAQKRQLQFLRYRGAHYLLVTAVANCLESYLGRVIADLFSVSFGTGVSPEEAEELWRPIIEIALPLTEALKPAVENGLTGSTAVNEHVRQFQNLIEATKKPNMPTYNEFTEHVEVDTD